MAFDMCRKYSKINRFRKRVEEANVTIITVSLFGAGVCNQLMQRINQLEVGIEITHFCANEFIYIYLIINIHEHR